MTCVSLRASSQVCFSASAYAPTLHRQFDVGGSVSGGAEGLSPLRGERLVGDAPTGRRLDDAVKSVERMALHVPFVQPESELVHIAGEMLRTRMMVNAMKAA